MAMPELEEPPVNTLQDALARLGSIPLDRIRWNPHPGTAREEDVLARPDGEKRLVELVDGVLVEKPMGYYESLLAVVLIQQLGSYLQTRNAGIVLGADAPLRLKPGSVRLPDVSFVSWTHFPNRKLPRAQIGPFAPDLAVEIISPGNTAAEMDRKLREYFAAGTVLAWLVYPESRTVRVYRSATEYETVAETGVLNGGTLLPGFTLSVREWFDRAGERDEA